MDAVISRTASPPADKSASIPGPALAPNTFIACEVFIPALPKRSIIVARSFVAGFTSSNDNPNSSNTPSAAVDGFISETSDCRSAVPAVEPS